MERYDEVSITSLVEELKSMVQDDADKLAARIETEIMGDLSPYSDGDDLIDEHIDILDNAESLVERFNK